MTTITYREFLTLLVGPDNLEKATSKVYDKTHLSQYRVCDDGRCFMAVAAGIEDDAIPMSPYVAKKMGWSFPPENPVAINNQRILEEAIAAVIITNDAGGFVTAEQIRRSLDTCMVSLSDPLLFKLRERAQEAGYIQ